MQASGCAEPGYANYYVDHDGRCLEIQYSLGLLASPERYELRQQRAAQVHREELAEEKLEERRRRVRKLNGITDGQDSIARGVSRERALSAFERRNAVGITASIPQGSTPATGPGRPATSPEASRRAPAADISPSLATTAALINRKLSSRGHAVVQTARVREVLFPDRRAPSPSLSIGTEDEIAGCAELAPPRVPPDDCLSDHPTLLTEVPGMSWDVPIDEGSGHPGAMRKSPGIPEASGVPDVSGRPGRHGVPTMSEGSITCSLPTAPAVPSVSVASEAPAAPGASDTQNDSQLTSLPSEAAQAIRDLPLLVLEHSQEEINSAATRRSTTPPPLLVNYGDKQHLFASSAYATYYLRQSVSSSLSATLRPGGRRIASGLDSRLYGTTAREYRAHSSTGRDTELDFLDPALWSPQRSGLGGSRRNSRAGAAKSVRESPAVSLVPRLDLTSVGSLGSFGPLGSVPQLVPLTDGVAIDRIPRSAGEFRSRTKQMMAPISQAPFRARDVMAAIMETNAERWESESRGSRGGDRTASAPASGMSRARSRRRTGGRGFSQSRADSHTASPRSARSSSGWHTERGGTAASDDSSGRERPAECDSANTSISALPTGESVIEQRGGRRSVLRAIPRGPSQNPSVGQGIARSAFSSIEPPGPTLLGREGNDPR